MANSIEIPLTLDGDGIVQQPSLHDAEIIGLFLDGPLERRSLTIKLRTESGKNYQIVVSGLVLSECHAFSSQNVLFDIFIASGDLARERQEELERLVAGNTANRAGLIERLRGGKLKLLHISPSVGCEVTCLAEKVQLFD